MSGKKDAMRHRDGISGVGWGALRSVFVNIPKLKVHPSHPEIPPAKRLQSAFGGFLGRPRSS
eukprot:3417833-Rhodomonas_salina.2